MRRDGRRKRKAGGVRRSHVGKGDGIRGREGRDGIPTVWLFSEDCPKGQDGMEDEGDDRPGGGTSGRAVGAVVVLITDGGTHTF